MQGRRDTYLAIIATERVYMYALDFISLNP